MGASDGQCGAGHHGIASPWTICFPTTRRADDGKYYIYVASVDSHGEMSTAPGPRTGDGKNLLLSMRTLPTDASAGTEFQALYPGTE